MQKLELIDETFDRERCDSYTLAIQASNKGVSFTVKDTVRNSFIALYAIPFEKEILQNDEWSERIDALFSKYDILTRGYKKVYLSYESPLFTLIPESLFVPEKALQLFSLVWDLPESFELQFNKLSKMVLLFAMPSSLTTKILEKHKNTMIIGYALPLLNISTLTNISTDENLIFTSITDTFVVNAIVQKGCISNLCPYFYQNVDDLLYHIVNASKQFNINPGNSILTLANINNNQESLLLLISKFFRKVNVDKGFQSDHFAFAIDKYKVQYWNLFNLSQCG